jgi:hypothetical protein
VTFSPDWVYVAFQRSLICWSPGKVQVSVHGLIVPLPVLVSTTCPWKPPLHEFTSEYAAEQDSVPGELDPVGDGDGDGEGDGVGEGDGEGVGVGVGDGDGDAEGGGDVPGAPV